MLLRDLYQLGEIFVEPALIPQAIRPLKRMLDFTAAARMKLAGNA
ncbi:hypothetical protein [Pseudomonas fluorescens]|nr:MULTISPECIES: hypothetical protein [Pseudomonas]